MIFATISGLRWYLDGGLNQIENYFGDIPNVRLINAWGHPDITLEEIAVRLSIKDKGEIVLGGLSRDAYDYPKYVPIIEIAGYTFTSYSCRDGLRLSYDINIGNTSIFRRLLKKEFNKPIDVINSYDDILSIIDALPKYPKAFHYYSGQDSTDEFIFIKKRKSRDLDPLFYLAVNDSSEIELLKSFDWKHRECIDQY